MQLMVDSLAAQKNELEAQLLHEVATRADRERHISQLESDARALISQMKSPQPRRSSPPQAEPSPAESTGFAQYLMGDAGSELGESEMSMRSSSSMMFPDTPVSATAMLIQSSEDMSTDDKAQVVDMLHMSGHWDTIWSLFHRFAKPDSGSIGAEGIQLMRTQVGLGLESLLPSDKLPTKELCTVDEFGLWLYQSCGAKLDELMSRLNGDGALDESHILSPSVSRMSKSFLQEMPLAEATVAEADASEALDKYSFALITIFTRYCQNNSVSGKQVMMPVDFSRFCRDYKIVPILVNEKTLRVNCPTETINFSDFLLQLWRLACIGFAGPDYDTDSTKARALATFLQL